MRFFYSFLLLVFLISETSHAQISIFKLLKEDLNPPPLLLIRRRAIKPPPAWYQCQVDKDCVHIDFYCAEAIVNKKFYRRSVDYYRSRNESNRCVRRYLSSKKELNYKVFCQNKICRRQGLSPNPPIFTEFRQEAISENIFIHNIKRLRDEED